MDMRSLIPFATRSNLARTDLYPFDAVATAAEACNSRRSMKGSRSKRQCSSSTFGAHFAADGLAMLER